MLHVFVFRLLTLGTTIITFLFYVFSVDLVSGFNVATVNHDSRIDWLEVRHWPIPIPIYLLRCENRTRGTKREKRDQKEREG